MHVFTGMKNPSWWTNEHETTWQRVKGAMKRDWEQTKADWSKAGHELNQGVGDTVKQMAGKEPIPPADKPNWEAVEPEYRYATGARVQYGKDHPRWDERLESKLAADWEAVKDGKAWSQVKARVEHAWKHGDEDKAK